MRDRQNLNMTYIGTLYLTPSCVPFQPQWVRNHAVAGCWRIASWGAHVVARPTPESLIFSTTFSGSVNWGKRRVGDEERGLAFNELVDHGEELFWVSGPPHRAERDLLVPSCVRAWCGMDNRYFRYSHSRPTSLRALVASCPGTSSSPDHLGPLNSRSWRR